jgi:hypothetical protein
MSPVLGWGTALKRRADFETMVKAKSPGAYWRLDEASGLTAADASGNSCTLTAGVAPTWGGGPSGTQIGGHSASGFTTSTRMKSANGLFGTMTSFTFMAAIKTTGTAAASILCRDVSNSSADRHFQFTVSNGRPTLITFTPANAAATIQATATVNDNTWRLVFGLWTGTQLRLRSAGADLASPVAFTSLRTGTTAIYLGLREQGPASWVNPFVGSLDEVAIWPNAALSDSDMDALHDAWAALN